MIKLHVNSLVMIFSWLIIQLSSLTIAYSQSNFRFQHFTTADGLAADGVFSIVQDSLGYIWFQHSDALTRYDGYTFKVYKYDPNYSEASIKSGSLGELQLDYNGNVWIGLGEAGWFRSEKIFTLTQYNRKTDGFINHTIDLDGGIIKCFDFDKDGKSIWFGTDMKQGLFHYNLQTKEFIRYFNSDSLRNGRVNSVYLVKDVGSFLLLQTPVGVFQFDKIKKTFHHPSFTPADTSFLKQGIITMVKLSKNSTENEIIFSTPTEFVRVNKDMIIEERFKHLQELSLNVDKDSNGVYWFTGSNNGLHRWNPETESFNHFQNIPEDHTFLAANAIESLIVDRDGNVWVGTENSGVSKLNKQSLQFYNFSFPGINSATFYDSNDKSYALVFQSKSVPFYVNPDSKLFVAPIHIEGFGSTQFQDFKLNIFGFVNGFYKGKKDFWVSSTGVYGLPINPKTGMIENAPIKKLTSNAGTINSTLGITSGIYEDNEGNVWVGNKYNSLNKIVAEGPFDYKNSIVSYRHSEIDTNSIGQGEVYSLLRNDEKSFWVLYETGVDLFQDNVFKHVFKDHGIVNAILKGSDGSIYISTPHGLYISRSGKYPYSFEFDPVLKNFSISDMTEDSLGRLWLINFHSLSCYEPKKKTLIHFDFKDGINHLYANSSNFGIVKDANGVMMTKGYEGITLFNPTSLEVSAATTRPIITRLEVNNIIPSIRGTDSGENDFSISSHVSVLSELVIDYQHNNFSFEFASMEMIAPDKNLYQHKLDGYDQAWIQTDWKNRRASYTNLPAGEYIFRVKASNHHGVWSGQEKNLKVIILPPPWRTWWAYTGYGFLFLGVLYVARRNIVQRERLKANFKLAKVEQEKEHFELEKVKEVDKVKTSFFTNISHEFRTPLTLIKGPIQDMMDQFKDEPKVQARLKLIQRNSDLLLKLINQLLDLAKLESGSLKEEKTEAELNTFIKAITSSFSSLAHQKNVQLDVKVPAEHYLALFDKDKLETILINLINNAIKFTPAHGSVTVFAELMPDAQWLSLKVRDTGIGIPENQQSKIFERFHQVSEAHKEVGTGIGLALVKELVALMKGTISVCSEIGKGSEFHVKLPIEILQKDVIIQNEERLFNSTLPTMVNEQRITSINDEKEEAIAKPHILVVEDNADLRAFIIDSLGNEFYFFEAKHGKQGLDIATQEVPDLIISDVMMPEMDGITMTGLIKKDIRSSHIPLILLTAKSTEDSKLSGLQHGADDYLTKPFNKYELQLKVHNGIMSRARLREKVRMELLMESSIVKVQSADEQFLMTVKQAIQRRLGDETLSVESLAEEIGMSRVQLYRKVVALTGLSVNELIRSFRLQKASHLLQQKWGSVSQVAYEVGFSNLSYFSKCFRDEYGVLPSEFSMPSN